MSPGRRWCGLLAGRLLAGGLLAVGLLAGCGAPPELAERRPADAPPAAADPHPSLPASVPPLTASPGAGYPDDRAVRCDDQVDPELIVDLLRAEQLLDPDTSATVGEGPLCAGEWQFTVLTVPDLDPLRVVTRGSPDQPELVTAGTEVCSVEVRVHAPPGIQAAADCVS